MKPALTLLLLLTLTGCPQPRPNAFAKANIAEAKLKEAKANLELKQLQEQLGPQNPPSKDLEQRLTALESKAKTLEARTERHFLLLSIFTIGLCVGCWILIWRAERDTKG